VQVILLEKVVNLGQLGEVVKVKEGFARNYLIPQGKARRATEDFRARGASRGDHVRRPGEAEKASHERGERVAVLRLRVMEVRQGAGSGVGALIGAFDLHHARSARP